MKTYLLFGFYMLTGKNMSITSEMHEYIENLMKPLITNEKLQELFKTFQAEIVKRFEHNLKEQNTKIEELESILVMKKTAKDNLVIKCDDNEQYSRRSYMRIHDLHFKRDEDHNVMEKIGKCYRDRV